MIVHDLETAAWTLCRSMKGYPRSRDGAVGSEVWGAVFGLDRKA